MVLNQVYELTYDLTFACMLHASV